MLGDVHDPNDPNLFGTDVSRRPYTMIASNSELTPPDPKSCAYIVGRASQENRPNMLLVAVEKLRKRENDVSEILEVNIASLLEFPL